MDPRFFRQYLDILNEAPPAGVGPNVPTQKSAAPTQQFSYNQTTPPTQAQADKFDADINAAAGKLTQGGEKMGAGNYASGAMTALSGANDAANAAGMSLGDKVSAGWQLAKAAGNAGMAYLRGKGAEGATAAAAGSLVKDTTSAAADAVNAKNFNQDFNKSMTTNTNDPSMQKMQQDAQRDLITANSFKNYVTGVDKTAGELKSGDATAFDRLGQQTMYRQDTMSPYLDISKKQSVTGQQVQTPGELMGKETPAGSAPTTPVQEEGEEELQKLKEFLNKRY